jgi:hypothetical protein
MRKHVISYIENNGIQIVCCVLRMGGGGNLCTFFVLVILVLSDLYGTTMYWLNPIRSFVLL